MSFTAAIHDLLMQVFQSFFEGRGQFCKIANYHDLKSANGATSDPPARSSSSVIGLHACYRIDNLSAIPVKDT